MKKIIIVLLLAIAFYKTNAQNDIDALRYSKSIFGSTARSAGMAGAVGAIGAELATTAVNPAGIGFYRKDEFSLSFSFLNFKNSNNYLGIGNTDYDFKLQIPNVGLVVSNLPDTNKVSKDWQRTSLAISFQRSGEFNHISNFSGINTKTSLMDYFAERAKGYTINEIRATDDDFDNGFTSKTSMAWEAYLFDSVAPKKYAAHASPIFHNILQKGLVQQSGGINDIDISIGWNYKNKLFIGAAFTYSFINFTERKVFGETNDPNDTSSFAMDNFTYTENLQTNGGGVFGKFGLISKFGDYLRFGVSFQTPKLLNLTDNYSFRINSKLRNGDYYKFESKSGKYEYNIITPYKITFSGTAIAGKMGLLSADVEFVDYSQMRLKDKNNENSSDNIALQIANDEINDKYKTAINYRIGGEIVFSTYRFRGGYALNASPFVDESLKDHKTQFYTGGLGIKEKSWSLDFALILGRSSETYQPYVLNDKTHEPVFASNKINTFNGVISYIYKF